MRTAVYIDGFNFYYWLKPLPFRWIDLRQLVVNAISRPDIQHEIVAVKYFTARVSDTQGDTGKSTRQDVYMQALSAVTPELSVYYGEFRRQQKPMRKAYKDGRVGPYVWVWDTEEKGSDVNLAVELVNDAWSNLYDMAVVVSNDSDLERALRIVKKKGRIVGVLVRGDAQVNSLKKYSSFLKLLQADQLRAALLPHEIAVPNTDRIIRIPHEWRRKEEKAGIRR